ncbi:MAG: hypothetical protein H6658_09830 [Ardenticatenaceae bacterium]|nr:hypothetical protein [Ardenticatenaceae bacterium]
MKLHIELLSEATFGRGDGITGYVDQEIEYDAATGLPFIRGRTIKGLLVEECANIFYVLGNSVQELTKAAQFLFGSPGSGLESQAGMHIGAARMPNDLRQAILYAVREEKSLRADEVLATLTDLRRQTAVDHSSGVPDDGSLRTMRVLRRGIALQADITFNRELTSLERALLSACVAAWRRGGTGRNRGRGRLKAYLDSPAQQAKYLKQFQEMSQNGTGGDDA